MKQKIAEGWSEIMTDTVHFVEGNNVWVLPTIAVMPVTRVYKYHYKAKVSDLRKLAKAMKLKPEKI